MLLGRRHRHHIGEEFGCVRHALDAVVCGRLVKTGATRQCRQMRELDDGREDVNALDDPLVPALGRRHLPWHAPQQRVACGALEKRALAPAVRITEMPAMV